ncbi:MAG: phosphate-starvation-inducible PsiE family protein [Caulobacteraceae bacterium]|nr:phosphate-starvation-inducible PsiE family protein [Caulobacteraceae bacterium]
MTGGLNPGPKGWGVRGAGQWLVQSCEIVVVSAAALLVIISVLLAAFILYALFIDYVWAGNLHSIESTAGLQEDVGQVFAGVLLLLLGLELLKSLTSFFVGHRLQLELIVVVAMIAVARHIMLMDFAHLQAASLVGAAALMLALAISYALVRKPSANAGESR